MFPRNAIKNAIDNRARNTGFLMCLANSQSAGKMPFDLNGYLLVYLVTAGLISTAGFYCSRFLGVVPVFGFSTPFEIGNIIILFVAVNMVHKRFPFRVRNKCRGYKPMHERTSSPAARTRAQGHHFVSMLGVVWVQLSPFNNSCGTIFTINRPIYRPDISKLRYLVRFSENIAVFPQLFHAHLSHYFNVYNTVHHKVLQGVTYGNIYKKVRR